MSLANFTLLYVEDNTDMQDSMKSFLEDEVKEFYQALNGEEGLALYNEKKPDIILSDINMPKMSGLEMSEAIKKLNENQPIILLSAFEETEILKEAINIGINNFIVKPIQDIRKLLAMLEKISFQLQSKIDGKIIQLKNAQRAQIINQIHDSVISTDLDGNILSCNYGAERLLGYKKEELVDKHVSILYLKEDLEQLKNNINTLMQDGSSHSEVRLLKKSKDIVNVDLSLSILYDENSKPMGMIGYSQDITKRKEIEKKFFKEKETFEAIFNGSKDGIAILDMESNFLDVNPAYIEMTGMTKEELRATSCVALAAPKDLDHSKKGLEEALRIGFVKNFEKDCLTKSGKYITVNMSISVLSNPDRILISVRDVTAFKNKEKELKHLASIDPLTKLYNRRHFNKTAESILDLAIRNKTDISMLMLDIDDFKHINDTFGHKVGDDVIISLASIMQEISRKSDIVSRWGGEEFLILLPDTNIDGAMVIAQKMRKAVEDAVLSVNDEDLKFTVSIGVSSVDIQNETNIEASINRADDALYEAKESGKNKVCSKVVLV